MVSKAQKSLYSQGLEGLLSSQKPVSPDGVAAELLSFPASSEQQAGLGNEQPIVED